MAYENDWWGSLHGEDYSGAMPNPLPRVRQLLEKYGYGQQLSDDRRVRGRGRPRKCDTTGVSNDAHRRGVCIYPSISNVPGWKKMIGKRGVDTQPRWTIERFLAV